VEAGEIARLNVLLGWPELENYDMLSGVLYAIAYLQPGAFPLFSAAGDFRPQMEHQGGAHQTEPDSRCHDRNQHC
jgi:hypothetical protein